MQSGRPALLTGIVASAGALGAQNLHRFKMRRPGGCDFC
jgi:hypothetical protein